MEGIEQVRFLGSRFDILDQDKTLRLVSDRARTSKPFVYLVTVTAQTIVQRNRHPDPRTDGAYDAAWLSTNDSAPANFLARRLWGFRLGRVTGSDLTLAVLTRAVTPDTPITIVGGSDEMESRLRQQFGLRTIHRHDPPMGLLRNPEAIEACARFIIDHPAPYTFIVAGAPQSEMVAHRASQIGGGTGVGLCVGASLNFATGLIARAPKAFTAAGFEWLYRLLQNPRGHARRVFVQSLPLLTVALRARLKGVAFQP